ncbi:MAG TPA: hypothetical protein VF432_10530 [Thermoanaerobaculia bacterium]
MKARRQPAGRSAGGPPAGGPILFALTAAAVRLLPLQWLHPLNWDEMEIYRSANWIVRGLVPFRDFWQHHTPLGWFLYAPFTLLSDSPGVSAILLMRWVQVPLWIAAFWLLNVWMARAGLPRFARWSAMALALSSSLLMTSAVELRLDVPATVFYLAGLVLWQRGTSRAMFFAGVMFAFAGLTNMRLGPLLVVTVLLLRFVGEGGWRNNVRATWIFAGGIVTAGVALLYFVVTDSLRPFLHSVLTQNYVSDKFAPDMGSMFVRRILVPFGVRNDANRVFDPTTIDLGGILILVLGSIGLLRALLAVRKPGPLFVTAVLQLASVAVIARMAFVYNYHLQTVALLMVPLIAGLFERMPRRGLVLAILGAAWCVNAYAAIFRGKELDLAYQDALMRDVHARTQPGESVWAGNPWALRRESAYSFWFLPDITVRLVEHGYARKWELAEIVRNPPAAVVADQYAVRWLAKVQPEIGPFMVRHYIPVSRNLWIPAPNARLQPGKGIEWAVLRDGTYRLFAHAAIGRHPWFRQPLHVTNYDGDDAARLTLRLPPPGARPDLQWWIDGRPAAVGEAVALRRGQRVRVRSAASEPLGLILLPGNDKELFRQPPPGATLEAASSRVTHVPRLGW